MNKQFEIETCLILHTYLIPFLMKKNMLFRLKTVPSTLMIFVCIKFTCESMQAWTFIKSLLNGAFCYLPSRLWFMSLIVRGMVYTRDITAYFTSYIRQKKSVVFKRCDSVPSGNDTLCQHLMCSFCHKKHNKISQ